MRWSLKALIGLGALLLTASAAQAATITPTTTADGFSINGNCTLREAFFATRSTTSLDACAPGTLGEDTVALGPGTYDLEPGASGPEDGNESGDLDTGPLNAIRVVGQGPGVTVIDGLRGDRVFDVFPNSSLALEGVTVRRGRSGAGGPGGAVRNQGTLTVVRSAFEDNAAGAGSEDLEQGGSGGAIWSGGPANPSVLISPSLLK